MTSVSVTQESERSLNFKPRLMILITGLEVGGAEIQVTQLAERLQVRGWDLEVMSLLPLSGLAGNLVRAGVRVASLEMKRGAPDFRAVLRLARRITTMRVQILHAHLAHASLLARGVRALVRVPVVISSLHSDKLTSVHKDSGSFSWRELAHRATNSLADFTTVVSKAAAERFVATRTISRNRLRVIPNGIDIRRFKYQAQARQSKRTELGILHHDFVWLAIGRLELAKDYSTMLSAFSLVPGRSLLLICGQGCLAEAIKQLAAELQIADRVRFLGIRNDVSALMSCADAFLLSSIFEGLPMVLLESSANELPMVVTNVGGNAEVVLNNRSGFLVEPSKPHIFAREMVRMISLSALERRQMGIAARQHVVGHYNLDTVVEQWEELYCETLAGYTRRATARQKRCR